MPLKTYATPYYNRLLTAFEIRFLRPSQHIHCIHVHNIKYNIPNLFIHCAKLYFLRKIKDNYFGLCAAQAQQSNLTYYNIYSICDANAIVICIARAIRNPMKQFVCVCVDVSSM